MDILCLVTKRLFEKEKAMRELHIKTYKLLTKSAVLLGLISFPLTVSAADNASVTNKADFSTDTIYQIVTDRFNDGNTSNNGKTDVFDKNDLKNTMEVIGKESSPRLRMVT